MKINAIICPYCKDTIYSRAVHDFHYCSCGKVAIDGGREYERAIYKDIFPERIEIEIDATIKELYDDWSYRKDKYGIIRKEK